ncbi:MAG TPA: type II toxin-antitoxin system VapC family toxin [Dermatophilaceae bacterium]|nr:type II toxin-antitoxin system VapC family toxin [Dermatophilaceae bacterium]
MTTFYVDSSAWAKLLVDEAESAAVEAWVDACLAAGDALVSSHLLVTELHRFAHREGVDPTSVAHSLSVLALALPSALTYRQAGLLPGHVRSLDALHVIQAIEVGADSFVSFDSRQLAVAHAAGLPTASPGA